MGARKFLYQDTAVVVRPSKHLGHTAIIESTLIRRVDGGDPKTYYRVDCECGALLTMDAANMDYVGSPAEILPEPPVERHIRYFLGQLGGPTYTALGCLPPRHREVLERRYGLTLDTPYKQSLREVGRVLGVTCERIRQIEAKALKTLRVATTAS
jgi:hypothetical protein